MVGFQEEVEMDRKVGFLANRAKTTRKEQNLVAAKMPLREQSKDAVQHVPHVRHTREGRERHELERHTKSPIANR